MLTAPFPTQHRCAARGCPDLTWRSRLMCTPHEALIPAGIKSRLVAEHRAGQGFGVDPSWRYEAAAREAVAAVERALSGPGTVVRVQRARRGGRRHLAVAGGLSDG